MRQKSTIKLSIENREIPGDKTDENNLQYYLFAYVRYVRLAIKIEKL